MSRSPFALVPDLVPFLGATTDLVIVRRSFAFWHSHARAHGTIMWGRPTEQDVIEMCDVWDAHLATPEGPDPTLADIRSLSAVDVLAFEKLLSVFAKRNPVWRMRTGPQAILHSGGMASAAILGALQLVADGHRLSSFQSAGDALAWMGVPDIEPDLEALRADLLEVPDIIRSVRAALDESWPEASARALAKRLGLSARTLQRHLAAAGTSLRRERVQHLVARAERLLEGTELDLGAVAASLGVGSAARLIALFREVRKTTPGAFRRERRAASRPPAR